MPLPRAHVRRIPIIKKFYDCFLNMTSPPYSILMEAQILSIKQLSVLKQSIQKFIVEFRNKMKAFNGILFRH